MVMPKHLIEQIQEKKLIPFVGAGCSLAIKDEQGNRIFPNWSELLSNAATKLSENNNSANAQIINGMVEKKRLLDAAKEAQEALGGMWAEFLMSQFDPNLKEIKTLEFELSDTLLKFKNPLVITTNYDRVFKVREPDAAIWGINQPEEFAHFSNGYMDKKNKKAVWHMHGHIDKAGELILTPESYEALYSDEMIEESFSHATEFFRAVFRDNTLLFIGFSLADPWVTHEIANIIKQCPTSYGRHYALLKEGDTEGQKTAEDLNIEVLEYAEHGEPLIEKLNELLAFQNDETQPHLNDIEVQPKRPINGVNDNIVKQETPPKHSNTTPASVIVKTENVPVEKDHVPVINIYDKNANFCLSHLWHEAFTPITTVGSFMADPFLKAIDHSKLYHPLTLLQKEFMQQCQQAREDNRLPHPFHDQSNILISGPTSSGKTTLAEIYLFMNLFSAHRKCSVYLAPTRSLAQSKYRELVEKYGELTNKTNGKKLKDQILISTGEDSDKDHLLFKGQFAIACLVYEKANILFSQSEKLITNLGCVVVDELHMIQQTHRGVGVEMLLAKLQHERNRGYHGEQLKIIGISTEGRPPPSLIDFLTSAIARKDAPPITICSHKRPVEVKHHLILPPLNESSDYNDFIIGTFNDVHDRVLPKETRIDLIEQVSCYLDDHYKMNTQYNELWLRLNGLLGNILAKQRDSQLLVFVDSKKSALDFGKEILLLLKAREIPQWGAIKEEAFNELLSETEEDDITKHIRELAAYGIFLHHADIDRQIRSFIEQTFTTRPVTTDAPRILIATQTLSYGVNLAVDNVIILNMKFPTTSRVGRQGYENLSVCDFHNMAGRAGRLGLAKHEANVYIFSDIKNAAQVIWNYYRESPELTSQLFVNADSASYLEERRLQSQDIYRTLDFSDYTYPFASSILDALSHLTSKQVMHTSNKVPLQELVRFFRNTLFNHEIKHDAPEILETFKACMHSVLWRCSQQEYRLVDELNDQYSITELGAAVISTGTDLKSISPMIQSTALLHKVWQRNYGNDDIPVELHLLVVIVQKEIFITRVNDTPERKNPQNSWNKEMIDANRKNVKQNLAKLLAGNFAVFERNKEKLNAFIDDLVQNLDQNLISLQAANIKIGYTQGVTDSVLRLFCGILVWTTMEPMSEVRGYIQTYEGPNENARNMNGALTGFQNFINQISWKLRFLGTLIKKWPNESFDKPHLAADDDKELEQEIALWNLANRVRIGSLPTGVAFFYPTGSKLPRYQIAEMLKESITPLGLLSGDMKITLEGFGIDPDRRKQLLEDLQNKAKDSFRSLSRSMSTGLDEDIDNRRNMKLQRLWNSFELLFDLSLLEFPKSSSNYQSIDFDKQLLSMFNFAELTHEMKDAKMSQEARESIIISHEKQAMWWQGCTLNDENQKQYGAKIKILGIQFNKAWQVYCDKNQQIPFEQILRQEEHTEHLVMVTIPWVPLFENIPEQTVKLLQARRDKGYSTTLISLGAFATMITTIVRKWVSPVTYMTRFQVPHQKLLRLVLTRSVLKICDQDFIDAKNNLPNAIRENVIEFFEVGNDYQEAGNDTGGDALNYQVGWKKSDK